MTRSLNLERRPEMRKLFVPAILVAIAVGVPAAASGGKDAVAPQPKHLQAKVTIVLGDKPGQMYFATTNGKRGGPFALPAGKTVGIRIINRGSLEHEILFGRSYAAHSKEYGRNLFASLTADLFVFKPVKMEIGSATFGEIELEPGGEMWIRTAFPAKMRGTWEVGCLLEGHREAGMTGSLVIR
jgi:uncharacterized cupredoxin-like copper-binding protein